MDQEIQTENLLKLILKKNSDPSVEQKKSTYELTTFLNPVSYHLIRKNHSVLKPFHNICIDGIGLVWLLKLFGLKEVQRLSFDNTSLAKKVFNYADDNNLKIYFIGSKVEEINNFVKIVSKKYPNMNIVGYRNGYFSNSEVDDIYKKIYELNPDYLIAGLGTPKQEEFLGNFVKKYPKWIGRGYTCGGFFHQTQESIEYFPKLIDKLNLRMPYRLFKEKLFYRLFYYPKFIIQYSYDYFSLKKNI